MNTSRRAAVAPVRRRWHADRPAAVVVAAATSLALAAALLALAVALLALAGCGGSAPSASTVLRDTFSSHRPIDSGVVDVSLELTGPEGRRGRHGFTLLLEGPFQAAAPGRVPDFALQITLEAGQRTLTAGAISRAGRLYVQLSGRSFIAPRANARALERGYTPLGIEPLAWLTHASLAGTTRVAGVEVTHVVAGLDAARFLADAEGISAAGLALGEGLGASLLTPARAASLSSSIRGGRVDVYTGSRDHLLRRLRLRAGLASDAAARAALGDLAGGTLRFGLQFVSLGRPQTITAPARPLPLSQLGPALERLGRPGGSQPPA
jgi:hypothetical protein